MILAPIILFVYNRPLHTRKTLESLESNHLSKESELFIFADGPKINSSSKERDNIEKTRKIIREKNWCGHVNIIERKKNIGLDDSVIEGVTNIINKFGKIIVLEDDLILSKNFISYMNNALDKYQDSEQVMQISGYMYPAKIKGNVDAFFLPFTSSWGWATWKRSWNQFDKSAHQIEKLENNLELRRKFDLNNSYNYYKMIKNQIEKNQLTWDVLFYLSIFMKNGLVLYPKKTLVINNGLDGSGTHCLFEMEQGEIDDTFIVQKYDKLELNKEYQDEVYRFLSTQNNLLRRIYNTLIKKNGFKKLIFAVFNNRSIIKKYFG